MNKKHISLLMKQVLSLFFISFLFGCQVVSVEPWEREYLSQAGMQKPFSNLSNGLKQHVYFSKEASSGSSRASAGGCGCN